MEQPNVCSEPPLIEIIPETTEQKVAVIRMLKKSPIESLPKELQNMIYEYSADTKPKDNFIRILPTIMSHPIYRGSKVKFYDQNRYIVKFLGDDCPINSMRVKFFKYLKPSEEFGYEYGRRHLLMDAMTNVGLYMETHATKQWLHLVGWFVDYTHAGSAFYRSLNYAGTNNGVYQNIERYDNDGLRLVSMFG
jgi:hypothetical protein